MKEKEMIIKARIKKDRDSICAYVYEVEYSGDSSVIDDAIAIAIEMVKNFGINTSIMKPKWVEFIVRREDGNVSAKLRGQIGRKVKECNPYSDKNRKILCSILATIAFYATINLVSWYKICICPMEFTTRYKLSPQKYSITIAKTKYIESPLCCFAKPAAPLCPTEFPPYSVIIIRERSMDNKMIKELRDLLFYNKFAVPLEPGIYYFTKDEVYTLISSLLASLLENDSSNTR